MKPGLRLFGVVSIALPMLIPPVVFMIVAFAEDMSRPETISALINQFSEPKNNLLMIGLLGLFPVLLLFVFLWVYRRVSKNDQSIIAMAWGGLIPIVAVLVWVNLQFWPIYLPSRVYPGFPHGLEFLIGPGLFAPVGMALGVLISWVVLRKAP